MPGPRSAAPRTLGGGAGRRAGGPDGGAGAGPARAPREMPSRARCRLYLRSRLTSAARVPRARAPPWDLARPLRPHSPAPPRDAPVRALPAQVHTYPDQDTPPHPTWAWKHCQGRSPVPLISASPGTRSLESDIVPWARAEQRGTTYPGVAPRPMIPQ
ncbi:unnamed protein product [Nyctereutes procyonoides]|uniref:(raccoon dog) hypothetical protein n=1 Tax=Nyctereutes procyonoides TaxID=34880 RepID=A0A811Z7J1_NYCPR|nr:unnamed protein product [Nyctereutes procyonoides]